MLKASVGLGRKLSHDYNSNGHSVTLEGEIAATPDDHETVLGRIQELFSLAEEALTSEIDRDQGEHRMGHHDEPPTPPRAGAPTAAAPTPLDPPRQQRGTSANSGTSAGDDAVTNKQVQFVFSLAKRYRLANAQLEAQIERLVGRRVRVEDLTKREAGRLIDALTQDDETNSRREQR
jgi:hypothetical protein